MLNETKQNEELGYYITNDCLDYLIDIEDHTVRENIKTIFKNALEFQSSIDSSLFGKKLLPILNMRIFANLISNNFFSIRPMIFPYGFIHYIRTNENGLTEKKNSYVIVYNNKIKDIKIFMENIDMKYFLDYLSMIITKKIDRRLINCAIELGKKNRNFIWDEKETSRGCKEDNYNILYSNIQDMIKYVGKTSNRGDANNIIISDKVATILSYIGAFDIPLDKFNYINKNNEPEICYLGTIKNGKIKVWLDLTWESKENESGYVFALYNGVNKNDSNIVYSDSGIIYSPYFVNFVILHPETKYNNIIDCELTCNVGDAVVSDIPDSEKYYAYMAIR